MKGCNEEDYLESDMREKRANMNQGQLPAKQHPSCFSGSMPASHPWLKSTLYTFIQDTSFQN
jgi:hypothetical protein